VGHYVNIFVMIIQLIEVKVMNKLMPLEAGKQFILKYFPQCQGAVLAGSVVRGEATDTSDLDIVVFDESIRSSYRESLIDFGWAIEVFVHNKTSYIAYFESDYLRAMPSLPRMVSEGIILKDDGMIELIKNEANELLEIGPEEWSLETIITKRYFITDSLDDFIGCTNRAEEMFVANKLAELVSEFILRTNRKWIGTSKWIVRSLKQYDEKYSEDFVEAFDVYYKKGEKNHIINLVDKALEPYGGRIFNGFSSGKQ
jgi:predicted nucleotidyltransferase